MKTADVLTLPSKLFSLFQTQTWFRNVFKQKKNTFNGQKKKISESLKYESSLRIQLNLPTEIYKVLIKARRLFVQGVNGPSGWQMVRAWVRVHVR